MEKCCYYHEDARYIQSKELGNPQKVKVPVPWCSHENSTVTREFANNAFETRICNASILLPCMGNSENCQFSK
jgi:hypothetical protein